MSMVIAVREDRDTGAFIGFYEDSELLECSECGSTATYTLRCGSDQKWNLPELRFRTLQMIRSEHPRHSDKVRVA